MADEEIDAAAARTWRLGDRVVNRMGFGSMRLTVDPDAGKAIRVLRLAVELGVDHIDTAAFYFSPGGILDVGDGPVRYATELVRRALHPYRQGVFIATKVGPGILPGGAWGEARTGRELRYQVEENLRRLRDERLDLVNLRVLRGGEEIGERHGVTGHQVRLAWTLHQGPHVLAIPGTGSESHLRANIAAAALRLGPGDLADLDAAPTA